MMLIQLNELVVSLGGDEHVLESDKGGGYITFSTH